MALWLITIALCLAADPVAPTSAVLCTVIEVHDGDTIIADMHLPFGIDLPRRSIRLYGADALEVSRTRQTVGFITDEELAKGKIARDDLAKLLKTCDLYAEDSGHGDPYGRPSAILWAKPKDGKPWILIAAWLEQRGYLRTPRAK